MNDTLLPTDATPIHPGQAIDLEKVSAMRPIDDYTGPDWRITSHRGPALGRPALAQMKEAATTAVIVDLLTDESSAFNCVIQLEVEGKTRHYIAAADPAELPWVPAPKPAERPILNDAKNPREQVRPSKGQLRTFRDGLKTAARAHKNAGLQHPGDKLMDAMYRAAEIAWAEALVETAHEMTKAFDL